MQMRSAHKLLMGSMLAGPLMIAASTSSAGWHHPADVTLEYFIPGPGPGGPPLGLCKVRTGMYRDARGDFAQIEVVRNGESHCKPGSRTAWARLLTVDTAIGEFVWAPVGYSTDDWPGLSVGQSGLPLFGAEFGAINVFGYTHTWSVGVFP
jgi:hypothetical protein